MIKKISGKWYLYSRDGSKKLGGPYDTPEEAKKREREVQFFKHQKEGEGMPTKVKTEKAPEVPKGYKPKSLLVKKLHEVLGISEVGGVQNLIDTFGDWADGSVTTCVSKLQDVEGIDDPTVLCAWLKDQWSGTTTWRGEEKKVGEEYLTGPEQTEIEYIPSTIITFRDLKNYKKLNTLAEELKEINNEFQSLIWNVLYCNPEDSDLDRIELLYNLVYEYSEMIPKEIENIQTEAGEAATVKSAVINAVKALDALLSERVLPKSILSQVKALRETFRKTWKDLEVEAESESSTESNEPEPEPSIESNEPEPMVVVEKVSESFDGSPVLVGEVQPEPNALEMDVVLIKPGWGNQRDNHYYSKELLASNKTVEKFVGAKMYETDHKPGEKSTRTWVSTITGVKGYTSDGAPIVRVAVHDPSFAQRIINLDSKGLLEKMECSILADAVAERATFEEGGRKGKKILDILNVESVDWVTRAGAGGHALRVSENEEGSQVRFPDGTSPNEPITEGDTTMLDKETIKKLLGETKLPTVSQERLAEGSYETEEDLGTAITKEVEYLKALTGSGRPFSVGGSSSTPEGVKEEDIVQRLEEIDRAFGVK